MENPFKKFFKKEVRLISEWSPNGLNMSKEEKLADLKAQRDSLKANMAAWPRGVNEATTGSNLDVRRMEELDRAINDLEVELGLKSNPSASVEGQPPFPDYKPTEEERARVDNLMSKLRGSKKSNSK